MVHAVTALVQLAALCAFAVGVFALNQRAPRRMAARVFKLHWLLGTLAGGCLVALILAKGINLPARLQTTPVALVKAHDVIRETCRVHYAAQRFDDAYDTISKRTKTAELVGEHAQKIRDSVQHKTSVARLLSPILNFVLFHTGVTIVFVPALLRLLLLLWQKRQLTANGSSIDAKFENKERREFGVFLPIMNVVTLLSLCVSPAFYFFIEPGRAQRCIYSSGHWYTFTCTCLTFAIVITHLYRNRTYCRSSMALVTWYYVWFCVYIACALMVLKNTQTFYHDSLEAVDGIMQALPAFTFFVLILIVYQFLTASARDIDTNPGETAMPSSDLPAKAGKKAKAILGLAHDQATEKARKLLGLTDDQPTSRPTSAKKKKQTGDASTKSPSAPAPVKTTAESEEDEDTVLINASEAEPSPAVASKSSPKVDTPTAAAPSAPPMAPPMAPAVSATSGPRTDIKITKKSDSAKKKQQQQQEDPTTAMLEGIKKGVKLRHTTVNANRPSGSGDGLMGALAAKLAQARLAIDGEKEEPDDAEWAE